MNARWIVLARDTPDGLAELSGRLEDRFPVLVDENGQAGSKYGLLWTPEEHGGHVEPGVFILRNDGSLEAGSYATGPMGRMSVDDAFRVARHLNRTE